MTQYKTIVLSEMMVFIYAARDHESLKTVLYHVQEMVYIGLCYSSLTLLVGFSLSMLPQNLSALQVLLDSLSVFTDHATLSFSLHVGNWRQR